MINEPASDRSHIIDWDVVQCCSSENELALGRGAEVAARTQERVCSQPKINPMVISRNMKVKPMKSDRL